MKCTSTAALHGCRCRYNPRHSVHPTGFKRLDIIDTAATESAAEGYSRIALGVEYKGSRYRGWQRQASGVPSVQQALEQALSKVANEPISVICAGRTDA